MNNQQPGSEMKFNDKLEKFRRLLLTYVSRGLVEDFVESPLIECFAFRSWADSLITIRLRQEIYGRQGERLIYHHPRDWWQALKRRFAPIWFLHKWPVRETEIVFSLKLLYPKGEKEQPVAHVTVYRDGHEFWLEGIAK